jgi:hypothetical protein
MTYHLRALSLGTVRELPSDDALAAEAGIPVVVLRAIRSIESGGSPSAVRFEPHLFHRNTSGRYRSQVPFTPAPGVSFSRTASETNRAAFERARQLDEPAAIRSTSWGLYQVLGGHLLRQYPSNPVAAFDANPADVSDRLLVSWFHASPRAQRAATSLRIMDLAQLYNGSTRWGERVAAAVREQGVRVVMSVVEWAPIAAGVGAVAVLGAGALTYYLIRRRRR